MPGKFRPQHCGHLRMAQNEGERFSVESPGRLEIGDLVWVFQKPVGQFPCPTFAGFGIGHQCREHEFDAVGCYNHTADAGQGTGSTWWVSFLCHDLTKFAGAASGRPGGGIGLLRPVPVAAALVPRTAQARLVKLLPALLVLGGFLRNSLEDFIEHALAGSQRRIVH